MSAADIFSFANRAESEAGAIPVKEHVNAKLVTHVV